MGSLKIKSTIQNALGKEATCAELHDFAQQIWQRIRPLKPAAISDDLHFTVKLKHQRNRANEHRKSDRDRNRLPYRNHFYFSATGKDFVATRLTGE